MRCRTRRARPRAGSVAALGAIVAGALILQIAGTIVNTVVPLRMALAGQPPVLIGLVGSAYSVGFLVGCFWIPTLVRRIGHIRGFAVAATVQAATTLSFVLLPEPWWGLAAAADGSRRRRPCDLHRELDQRPGLGQQPRPHLRHLPDPQPRRADRLAAGPGLCRDPHPGHLPLRQHGLLASR